MTAVVAGTGASSVRHLDPGRITQYLTGMTQTSGTRNMHRRIVVCFANWLEAERRIPDNPIGGKKVRTFSARRDEAKRRRAMTADELARLFVAAREQPLRDATRSRGGRPRRDGGALAAPRPARVSAETLQKKTVEGQGRWLMYRIAAFTGLRRGELSRLQVRHLKLGEGPMIHLPGEFTKSGGDARLMLPGFLAAELADWLAMTGRRGGDTVVDVPDGSNLAKMHRRLLRAAGIEYQDGDGKYADYHSLRTAANTLLRRAKIPRKERMEFLRHRTASLTDSVYDDEAMVDMASVLDAFQGFAE